MMKFPPLSVSFVCALAFGLPIAMKAEPTAVSLRVELANRSDMNPKDRIVRTHSRRLLVFVTNNSDELLDLKVKHEVFGRDMFTHDIVKVSDGETPLQVKPHSEAHVETVEAKCISSEKHFDPKLKKIIDPSGATIVGEGVQVLRGDKLMGEWYDPATMKEQWGKAAPLNGAKPATPPPPKPVVPPKPAATPPKK